jgi:hypothetical protein
MKKLNDEPVLLREIDGGFTLTGFAPPQPHKGDHRTNE